MLRHVNALRVGQQHSGTDAYRRQQHARCALGLAPTSGDWTADWELLRHAVVDALRTVRQELVANAEPAP